MKTIIGLLAALLLVGSAATPLRAQTFGQTQFLTAQDAGTCATAGACATILMPNGSSSVSVQLSGTFSATVTFEGSLDGANWTAVNAVAASTGTNSTTAAAPGIYAIANAGFGQLRVRCSTYTSGTVVVLVARGYATAKLLSPAFSTVTAAAGTAGAPSFQIADASAKGFYGNATNQIAVSIGGVAAETFTAGSFNILNASAALNFGGSADTGFARAGAGELTWTATIFANLGTPANGTFAYCSDCVIAATCAGSGTGALAKRLNGVWVCN